MTKYPHAIYKSGNEIKELTVQQLREYRGEEFAEIKEKLFCPHIGCEARLIFREGAGGYYAKYRKSTHDDECIYKEDGEARALRYEVIDTIYGTLSDDDIRTKHKYAWKRLAEFENGVGDNQNTVKQRKKPKKIVSESKEASPILVVSDNRNGVVVEKSIPEGVKIRSERFYFRFLHNITRKDYPKNLNVVATLKSVEQEDALQGKFSIEYQGIKGEFLLPEVFYSGNKKYRGEQLVEFLKIIRDYIAINQTEIFVAGMCHVTEGGLDNQPYKLAVYNPDNIEFKLLNGRTASLITLVQYIKTKALV